MAGSDDPDDRHGRFVVRLTVTPLRLTRHVVVRGPSARCVHAALVLSLLLRSREVRESYRIYSETVRILKALSSRADGDGGVIFKACVDQAEAGKTEKTEKNGKTEKTEKTEQTDRLDPSASASTSASASASAARTSKGEESTERSKGFGFPVMVEGVSRELIELMNDCVRDPGELIKAKEEDDAAALAEAASHHHHYGMHQDRMFHGMQGQYASPNTFMPRGGLLDMYGGMYEPNASHHPYYHEYAMQRRAAPPQYVDPRIDPRLIHQQQMEDAYKLQMLRMQQMHTQDYTAAGYHHPQAAAGAGAAGEQHHQHQQHQQQHHQHQQHHQQQHHQHQQHHQGGNVYNEDGGNRHQQEMQNGDNSDVAIPPVRLNDVATNLLATARASMGGTPYPIQWHSEMQAYLVQYQTGAGEPKVAYAKIAQFTYSALQDALGKAINYYENLLVGT